MSSHSLAFDFETAPIADVAEYVTVPPPATPEEAPASRQRDALTWVAEEDGRRTAKRDKVLSMAATDIDLARIVCGGWRAILDGEPTVMICRDEDEERAMLTAFWRVAIYPRLIGFNSHGFDLPLAIRRSQYLGITPGMRGLQKPWDTARHLDLMLHLSFQNRQLVHSLDFYLRRFGIPNEDTTTGEDMPGLVEAGDWDAVAAHNRADVISTAQLAHRIGEWT